MLQLNKQTNSGRSSEETNGFIENSPIYVTSLPNTEPLVSNHVVSSTSAAAAAATSVQQAAADIVVQQPAIHPSLSSSLTTPAHPVQNTLTKLNEIDTNNIIKSPKLQANNIKVTTSCISQSSSTQQKSSSNINNNAINSNSVSEKEVRSSVLPLVATNNSTNTTSLNERRASSPFQNGRTEVLIGADDNKFKTTALIENTARLSVDNVETR